MTLFGEGDGSVFIDTKGYPIVSFCQKERDVLDHLTSLVENGRFYQNKDIWQLKFNGKYCIPLLEVFSRHVVGKKFLDRLNRVLEFVDMPLAVQHPLTLDGYAGFWDAEGSSDNKPSIYVSQKDREILDMIMKMFGGGISRFINPNGGWQYEWCLGGEKAHALYKILLERSHCPAKATRLRQNFEGPSYYETHKEEIRAYTASHRDVHKVYINEYNAKQKALRDWIKTHPEEVTKLLERSQST